MQVILLLHRSLQLGSNHPLFEQTLFETLVFLEELLVSLLPEKPLVFMHYFLLTLLLDLFLCLKQFLLQHLHLQSLRIQLIQS